MLLTFFKGFSVSVSVSLIVAIGAQNAFVVRQGLLCCHLFLTALICASLDAILISLGILGFGHLVSSYPLAIQITKYFAILFLLIYGAFSIKAAFKPQALSLASANGRISLKRTVCILLALTLLNPHAYLDTVILLGSIASQHPTDEQVAFGLGAISASFAWFFGITYGSRLLAPLLCKPLPWKIFDVLTALMMLGIAATLLFLS